MGFAGHVLTMVAVHFSLSSPPCAVERCTLPKFWQCTELKHLTLSFHWQGFTEAGNIWDAGRMSLWCLPEPETVVGLRALGWEVFLVPLTQQGANVSSGKSITFLTVLDGIWERVGKKEDEGRHVTLFLLAQGAQEIVRWVVLFQMESCFLFSLFPLAA